MWRILGYKLCISLKISSRTYSNIDDFICRMCVSYLKSNFFTKPFEFPVPHYGAYRITTMRNRELERFGKKITFKIRDTHSTNEIINI